MFKCVIFCVDWVEYLGGVSTHWGYGEFTQIGIPVFEVAQQFKGTEFELDAVMNYARDYSVIDDLRILISWCFQKAAS